MNLNKETQDLFPCLTTLPIEKLDELLYQLHTQEAKIYPTITNAIEHASRPHHRTRS